MELFKALSLHKLSLKLKIVLGLGIISTLSFLLIFLQMGVSLYYQEINKDFYQNSFLNGIRSIQTEKNFIILENNIEILLKGPNKKTSKIRIKKIKRAVKTYKSTLKVFLKGFNGNFNKKELKSSSQKLFNFTNELLKEFKNNKHPKIKKFSTRWNKFKKKNLKIRTTLQELGSDLFISGIDSRDNFKILTKKINYISIGFILFLFLLFLAIYLIFLKKILPPLLNITHNIHDVSKELLKSETILFNTSSTMNELVDQKLADIEKTSESVFETEKIIDSSQELSKKCQSETKRGKTLIKNVSKAVLNFNKNMKDIDSATKNLDHIIKSFQDIDKKTKKINSIVSESRLLSFNAEIEAAHAGNFGKGFTVVAQEMGNLATSSGEISKSISDVVHDGSGKANDIIGISRKSIILGFDSSNEFSNSFTDLENSFAQIFELIEEVQSFSNEQTKGVRMAASSIKSIQRAVEEDSDQIKTLHSQTENLNDQFKILEDSFVDLNGVIFGNKK